MHEYSLRRMPIDKGLETQLNKVTYTIRGCVFNVYNTLGPGLLEKVYEEALAYEMTKAGLQVRRQVEVPIKYDGVLLTSPLRLDMLVNDSVIIECKSVQEMQPVFYKQLLTYLKLTGCRLGLLINFNTSGIAEEIHRVVL